MLSLALIGKGERVPDLAARLKSLNYSVEGFKTPAACIRKLSTNHFDAVVVFAESMRLSLLRKISSSELKTAIILVGGATEVEDYESLSGIFLIDADASSFQWQRMIEKARASSRRKLRASSLRRHLSMSPGLHPNPAYDLIANLILGLEKAISAETVLRSLYSLQKAVAFQDLLLIETLTESTPVARDMSVGQEPGKSLISEEVINELVQEIQRPSMILSHQSQAGKILNRCLNRPWESAIVMRFDIPSPGDAKLTSNPCFVFFVRNELDRFSESDRWLIEFAHGPVSTILEKIALLASHDRKVRDWTATFDSISEPLSIIDRRYRIIRANQAFTKETSLQRDSLRGKRCYSVFGKQKTSCSGCPVVDENPSQFSEIEVLSATPNAVSKHFQVWSYELNEKKPALRIQFYRNTSKQNQLLSALIQSEKMVALGALILSITHEINNPLAAVIARAQILLNSPGTPEGVLDDLKDILEAGMRARRIVQDLLGFGGDLVDRDVVLSDAVQATLNFAKTVTKGIRIELALPERLMIRGPAAGPIQQVLFNLITNGAHAMPDGGHLFIRVEKDENAFRFEVEDSGKGMSPERMSRIFEPFMSDKAPGKGTGLGLPIVKSLISRLGGTISAKSRPGQGTIFYFSLPETNFRANT